MSLLRFFVLIFFFASCSNRDSPSAIEEGQDTLKTWHDSAYWVVPSPLPQDSIYMEEWNSEKHPSAKQPTPEQLQLISKDGTLFERLSFEFAGEIHSSDSVHVLIFNGSIKNCPSVCQNFINVLSIDGSNKVIDSLFITKETFDYEIKVLIKKNEISLDSNFYLLSEEDGPAGIPEPTGIKRTSSTWFQISPSGKFIKKE